LDQTAKGEVFMGKKITNHRTALPIKAKNDEFGLLIKEVRDLVQSARQAVASTVNTLQVLTNFEIGRRIVNHEQKGAKRAEYGTALLKELSSRLTEEFGKGFSVNNLQLMRKFFIENKYQIQQTVSAKSSPKAEGDKLSVRRNPERPSRARNPFTLSWSHYVLLMTINDPNERRFYEIEATNEGWSLAELKRQKASALYERLALSRDQAGIRRLAKEGQIVTRPSDLLKEPLVLEFLGFDEKAEYSETDLESGIINHLENFLLELGKGFLFEARQKRFTFDEDHYFVDLVFYNRLLRCYVLIDLKMGKLTHQDLGQMQMYVNYFDRYVKSPEENPTVGLLLCQAKKDAVVELTLPKNANIHAREYKLYLPSRELLKQKILEWTQKHK
jgi:predicted nuclease of restriction endonuclease-like (RecB) superfamily